MTGDLNLRNQHRAEWIQAICQPSVPFLYHIRGTVCNNKGHYDGKYILTEDQKSAKRQRFMELSPWESTGTISYSQRL